MNKKIKKALINCTQTLNRYLAPLALTCFVTFPALAADLVIDRAAYIEKMRGFYLGSSIANWTGLQTEGHRTWAPYYTDDDWYKFGFILDQDPWMSDDDTDIEYIFQHAHETYNTSKLTGVQIRDQWLEHISPNEENFLWVSNQKAFDLMRFNNMTPPQTSLPENNDQWEMIDAQLTTEIFGLLSPGNVNVAIDIAELPIRTTAFSHSEHAANFYVIMHSLASTVDTSLSIKDQVFWLADQARLRTPGNTYIAGMYDWIKAEYLATGDKQNWESVRDDFHTQFIAGGRDGYVFREWYDSGSNFGLSIISLLFGEGDYKQTVKIGSLAGMDSDNPTATWGGLLGFMYGQQGLVDHFGMDFSDNFWITRTRINFTDVDTFTDMGTRAAGIVDLVVAEQMAGSAIDNHWVIPGMGNPNPVANFSSVSNRMMIDFNADISTGGDGELTSYQWNFGDGVQASGSSVTHTYTLDGIYTVELVVTNSLGVTDDYEKSITVSSSAQNIAPLASSVVASVLVPKGGGNHDIEIIRDGVKPSVGSDDSSLQYDTYDEGAGTQLEHIGYVFPQAYNFTKVIFQEGKHFGDGGYFSDNLEVQVRKNGNWTQVASSISPIYPYENNNVSFESYEFVISTPVTGDGIRIQGKAAGSAPFISVAELEVYEGPVIPGEVNIAPSADFIISTVTTPSGGGNHNINIIRDGVKPSVGNNTDELQYDTYDGGNGSTTEHIGYSFIDEHSFTKVVFQEGKHFSDGGFFNSGLVVQVRSNGQWSVVESTITPAYPYANNNVSFETYELMLTTATVGDGIRIQGMAGGDAHFISLGELEVYDDPIGPVPPEAKFITIVDERVVQFDASTSIAGQGSITQFDWDFGDGTIGTGINPTHTYGADGAFIVTLTISNSHDETAELEKNVSVEDVIVVPIAGFSTLVDGLEVYFDASSSTGGDGSVSNYIWDFGDGETATGRSVVHSYLIDGVYTATLRITNSSGETDDANKSLRLSQQGESIASQADAVIATVSSPSGGGNHNIEVIRDGVKPNVGNDNSATQYDTYDNGAGSSLEHIGYTYSEVHNFTKVIFQEGKHFANGGYFDNNLAVQVRVNGQWLTVDTTVSPTYPYTNNNVSYESYEFLLNNATVGDGIRIQGQSGGSSSFISVGELEVFDAPLGPLPPRASFTSEINELTLVVDANGSSGGEGTITEYQWNFGDGQTATGGNVLHNFGTPGVYTVTLNVTNDNQDTDTQTKILYVGLEETVRIAFFGDQGVSDTAKAVYELIQREQTDLVLHQGDLGYTAPFRDWQAQLDQYFDLSFPYLVSVGNHDAEDADWSDYESFLEPRVHQVEGLDCSGEYGVNYKCSYKGIDIVLSGINTVGSGHVPYMEEQLAASNATWKICSWHKNQRLMQVGGKQDETGWAIYEACLAEGGIIATGHEHSYSRTHLMSSFEHQTVASTSNDLLLSQGRSFGFVSGLGGRDVRAPRDGLEQNNWWASVLAGGYPNANAGVLFCDFNAGGISNKAACYFKTIDGVITDQFTLTSLVNADAPVMPTDLSTVSFDESIQLSWVDQSSNETGFNVYWSDRKTKPNLPQVKVPANTEQFIIPNLLSGTRYYVWLEATNLEKSRSQTISTNVKTTGQALIEDFVFLVVPDTQFMVISEFGRQWSNSYYDQYVQQVGWILNNQDNLNIKFIAHVGDAVENWWQDYQWELFGRQWQKIQASGIPWSLAPGNHDLQDGWSWDKYNFEYPIENYQGNEWIEESFPVGKFENTLNFFEASGMEFMVISIGYDLSSEEFDWADNLLKQYPDKRAILSTHDVYKGEFIELAKRNPNVFLVVSGHYCDNGGEWNRTETNYAGGSFKNIMSDYQCNNSGFTRYYEFKPSKNKIYAKTHRAWTEWDGSGGGYRTQSSSQFDWDYNME